MGIVCAGVFYARSDVLELAAEAMTVQALPPAQ